MRLFFTHNLRQQKISSAGENNWQLYFLAHPLSNSEKAFPSFGLVQELV